MDSVLSSGTNDPTAESERPEHTKGRKKLVAIRDIICERVRMQPVMKPDDTAIPPESISEAKAGSIAVIKSVAVVKDVAEDFKREISGEITASEIPAILTDFIIRLFSKGSADERNIIPRIAARDLKGGDKTEER